MASLLAPDRMAVAGEQTYELTEASLSRTSPTMATDALEESHAVDPRLHRRTLLKLDCLLLPFLALLFLFNALDKSNVGSGCGTGTPTQADLDRLAMQSQRISWRISGLTKVC